MPLTYFQSTSNAWGDIQKYFTNPQYQTAIAKQCAAVSTFAGYFDPALAGFPGPVFAYKDALAIYVDKSRNSAMVNAHPEWILKDSKGNPVYINYVENGARPQQVADIGNPRFRQGWIGEAFCLVTPGYGGVWCDDVNMGVWQIVDANGNVTAPIDPRTKKTMDQTAWATYFGQFLSEIRQAANLYGLKVGHNPVWYAEAYDFKTADVVWFEGGFSDKGLTGGTGQWSVSAFMLRIADVTKAGAAAVLGEPATDNVPYKIAGAWLSGAAGTGFTNTTPDLWDQPFLRITNADLGQPLSPAQRFSGVWQRSFDKGLVYFVEPGADSITLDLDQPMTDVYAGQQISKLTLSPSQGIVLMR